jgi:S1-C subfamily serine protease
MSFIPQGYLDSTLAIGERDANFRTNWMGTGFLFGWLITPPGETPLYDAFLVTNRHVLEEHEAVVIRCNLIEPPESVDFEVSLSVGKTSAVTFHSDREIDVAVVKLDDSILASSGIQIQAFSLSNASLLRGQSREFREGSRIFVLGYPLELVSEKRQFAICRAGCIARIRDFYAGQTKDFLIDAAAFPGNSGGPVLAPLPMYSGLVIGLVGIVYSTVLHREAAISVQTNEPRIMYEQNSGLAKVFPIDCAIECIQENIRSSLPSALLNPCK